MSPMLPTALRPMAGLLALVIVWPRRHEQPSNGRLVAEAFGVGLVTIALVWSAWVGPWPVERRWCCRQLVIFCYRQTMCAYPTVRSIRHMVGIITEIPHGK